MKLGAGFANSNSKFAIIDSMDKYNYSRMVQTAVVVFIFNKDEYLMLKRSPNNRIDPNKLNGVGGRVEKGENFLEAAVREIKEETGYVILPSNLHFCGITRLEGGYDEDWIMCLFKCSVNSKSIPKGEDTDDGKLVWIHKDKVLDSNYELISDLKYIWKDIVEENLFFANAQINNNEEVDKISISKTKVEY